MLRIPAAAGRQLPTDLERTQAHHDKVIGKADRVIDDFRRMDGALVIVRKRS